jgi:hypothetical protein
MRRAYFDFKLFEPWFGFVYISYANVLRTVQSCNLHDIGEVVVRELVVWEEVLTACATLLLGLTRIIYVCLEETFIKELKFRRSSNHA